MRYLRYSSNLPGFLLALAMLGTAASAQTRNVTPFAQADTSSPQATLGSFLGALEQNLARDQEAFLSYMASDRLYPNAAEQRLWAQNEQSFLRGLETMDLSGLPSGFINALAVEKITLLIDVISRVDTPPLRDVPTHEVMKVSGETSWRIPNTRIEIALVTTGPRRGEYLFSARTIVRLEEFHDALAETPYRPGPVLRYVESLGPYTSLDSIYATYSNSIDGFGIVPIRWLFKIPSGLNTELMGVSVWKLLLLIVCLCIGYLLARLTWSISGKMGITHRWRLFNAGLVISVLAWLVIPVCAQFHISGNVLYGLGVTSVVVLYFVGAWMAFIGTGAVADTVISLQSIREGSIDSQLIRLGARMAGLVIAMILLLEGADELGLPSYSVVAGIGVSGLAIAFASRETLANLLGSIVILMEKPFRSGHWIKVGDAEGVVEYIGFRSTRIRTSGDSVLSIPNGTLVNSVVDNLGMRGKRQQRFSVQICYDTPRDKLETFIDGVRTIISNHPTTDKEVSHVYLHEFGENGLEVLLYFYLRVTDYGSELREREGVLLQILSLAENLGITFIAPHQIDGSDHSKEPETNQSNPATAAITS